MAKKKERQEADRARTVSFGSFDSSQNVQEALSTLVQYLKQEKGLTLKELLHAYQDPIPEQLIPVQIFSFPLSPAESVTKYLKEIRGLKFREIGKILNRDERTIWLNYRGAHRKYPAPFLLDQQYITIPIKILADRSLSILEHVVIHLHTALLFSIKDIAKILNKHPSIVHTCLSRAKTKEVKPKQ